MNERERLILISVIYGAVLNNTETFHGRVGGDLAYLCGAIAETLMTKKCEFSKKSRIVQILRDSFAPEHKVWTFIELI